MLKLKLFSLVVWLSLQAASSLWSCSNDQDCSSLEGAVCDGGSCLCPVGTQQALGGSVCAPVAPYFTSQCVEDFQCSRLFTSYQCSMDDNQEGSCVCQAGSHYLVGRCWGSSDFGAACAADASCLGALRRPDAMSCVAGVCACAPGHYLRQRGECRRSGLAVGESCVLNEDCQFPNGACDRATLSCYDTTVGLTLSASSANTTSKMAPGSMAETKMASRQHGVSCVDGGECDGPFECSSAFGICVCPIGYYSSEDGTACFAELGSPSTEEQCVGLLAEIQDGVCTCPTNFYYDQNMRDCVKATLRLSDSCVSDAMCHTFGAAVVCGEPQEPWGLRSCSCIPELAVWDDDRTMCRLFVGLGEVCEADSDCLAGEVEILCRADEQGTRRCTCPDGLAAFEGLCLSTGLELGASCQVTQECTGAENSVCADSQCACADGYQQSGDLCAPELGGACAADSNCLVANSVCTDAVCQCVAGFTEYNSACWAVSSGHNSSCEVAAQCRATLGVGAACVAGVCDCSPGQHYRDQRCWPQTALFAVCERSSQCYLADATERTVCRNGLCQCDFAYPYSEELRTCVSGATKAIGNMAVIISTIVYLISNI